MVRFDGSGIDSLISITIVYILVIRLMSLKKH